MTAGDSLFVRWFPDLTPLDTAPGVAAYGQYGYSNVSGSALDVTWVVPSAGSTTSYSFFTQSAGGSLPDSLGQAAYTTASAVPEPSAAAALFGLAALMLGWRIRRRVKAA